jgi:DNA-directed RNA polymerase subunit RPC12/RpoP
MKKYYCIDCKKELNEATKYNKAKRCHSCEMKRRIKTGIMGFKGKNSPSYKNGITLKKHFCIDCKKEIGYQAVRCGSCARKGKNCHFYKDGKLCKDKKYYCIDCGIKILNETAVKGGGRCNSCKNTGKNSPSWKGGKTKNNKCIDCGISISYNGKRCQKCFGKSEMGKNNHRFGKPASHSKGDYYKGIFMRSNWEISYAKWLDNKSIKWLYEPKAFDLGNTTYTPDFYLPESDTYIEIKGYWRDDAKKKFKLFKKLFSNININVLMKTKLVTMGVLTKKRKE